MSKSKSLRKALVFACAASPLQAFALLPDCGAVTTLPATFPSGAQNWVLNGQIAYEYGGGLTSSDGGAAPDTLFASSKEKAVAAFAAGSGQSLVLTRTESGFGAYLWSKTGTAKPKLTPLLNQTVSYTSSTGGTIRSPLVDAQLVGGTVHLLDNHFLRRVALSDLIQGRYRPVSTRLPGCASAESECVRGAGLQLIGPSIVVLRKSRATGSWIDATLSTSAGSSEKPWITLTSPYDPTTLSYANLVGENSSDTVGSGKLVLFSQGDSTHFALGSDASASTLSGLPDYATRAAFVDDTKLSESEGAIAFRSLGTYFYRAGKAICRAFDTAQSLIVRKADGKLRIQGIDKDGHGLWVEIAE